MRRSAESQRVADALTLRRVVVSILGSRRVSEEDRRIVQQASPDAWRIVLTCECCATPLAARLRAGTTGANLPPPILAQIAAAERVEIQRVLAARAILDSLDDAGVDLGINLVILKGGALAAERDVTPLDLADVDALVDDDAAILLWNRLAGLGWRLKTGGPMPTPAPRVDPNHLVPIVPPSEGLSLELHTRAEYGSPTCESSGRPTRPLRGRRSLHRLDGVAGFVTVLEHCVIKHPPRRGHLRDLVLLADALAEAQGEHEAIEAALNRGPMAPELMAMYTQARALARGERVMDDEATKAFVSWKYAQFVRARGVIGPFLPGWSGLSYLPLERREVWKGALDWQLRYALGPVPANSPFAALAARAGGKDGPRARLNGVRLACARVARALYRLGMLATLVLTSRYIRRRIRQMSPS